MGGGGRGIVNVKEILFRKFEGKRQLGRPHSILEDNIKIHLKGILCEGVDWFHFLQDKFEWRALADTNFGFHYRWGVFWPGEWLSASQQGLCSIKSVKLHSLY
jgi:hypothetical protein